MLKNDDIEPDCCDALSNGTILFMEYSNIVPEQ